MGKFLIGNYEIFSPTMKVSSFTEGKTYKDHVAMPELVFASFIFKGKLGCMGSNLIFVVVCCCLFHI